MLSLMDEDPVEISSAFSAAMLRLRREFLSGIADLQASAAAKAVAEAAPFKAFSASGGIAKIPDGCERSAFWINAFNGLASLSIVELGATLELPRYPAYRVRTVLEAGDQGLSLENIEEGILRGNRPAPGWPFRSFGLGDKRRPLVLGHPDFRLHFALNCGFASCPPVRLYSAADLDRQLASAEANFAAAHFRPDPASESIVCSRVFVSRKRDFPGRWLDDIAYRGWKAVVEPFDLRPGPG
jgi:hypothetical protein